MAKKYYYIKSMADFYSYYRVACIIRMCDEDLIRDLEELGYRTNVEVDFTKHKEIITYKSGYYFPQEHVDIAPEEKRKWIDCGKNRVLFWLLVGMSNETDNRMVYIRKVRYRNAQDKWAVCTKDKKPQSLKASWKEATPEEILIAFGDKTTTQIDEIKMDGTEYWISKLKEFIPRYGKQFIFR